MGQQQLLLLVLSTVIVGLATVAGIQAFSENQAQATQDALTQKGVTMASDIQGLIAKPSQLGGIADSTAGASSVATKLGYEGTAVSVDGASGSNPTCTIQSDDVSKIVCKSDQAPQVVTVDLNTATGDINTTYGSSSP